MNGLTMNYGYKLHLVNFQRSLKGTAEQFPGIVKKVLRLVNQFEADIKADNEIIVKRGQEVAGGLLLTLEFPLSKIDLTNDGDWLTRAFPESTITGNTIQITLPND